MSLVDRVKKQIDSPHLQDDRKSVIEELTEFTARMRESGIMDSEQYTIALPDTAGKGLYRSQLFHKSSIDEDLITTLL